MEICPTRPTGTSKRIERAVRRDFMSIAQRVCGSSQPSLQGELDWSGYIGHGGGGFDSITGEFMCMGANNSFKPTPHRGVGHVPALR